MGSTEEINLLLIRIQCVLRIDHILVTSYWPFSFIPGKMAIDFILVICRVCLSKTWESLKIPPRSGILLSCGQKGLQGYLPGSILCHYQSISYHVGSLITYSYIILASFTVIYDDMLCDISIYRTIRRWDIPLAIMQYMTIPV